MDDPLPFNLWSLKVDQKTQAPPGRSQIVQTLSGMFRGKPIHALQLDNEFALDQQIGEILSNKLALVANREGDFCLSFYAAKHKFSEESTLVYLFEESGA